MIFDPAIDPAAMAAAAVKLLELLMTIAPRGVVPPMTLFKAIFSTPAVKDRSWAPFIVPPIVIAPFPAEKAPSSTRVIGPCKEIGALLVAMVPAKLIGPVPV
jgi:hypothetical protein